MSDLIKAVAWETLPILQVVTHKKMRTSSVHLGFS
jgi:hypothetical protein